jgi:hypothetical protein
MNCLGALIVVAAHGSSRRIEVPTSMRKVSPPTAFSVTRAGAKIIRIVSTVLAAMFVASAGLVFAAPPAHAKPIGTVMVIPGEGNDLSSIRLRTSGGCPAPANAYYAKMFGKGFSPDGLIVTATTQAGLQRKAGFDVYFAQTMRDFADLNGKVILGGRYDIVVYCIDKFPSRVAGEFTGSLEFTTPTTYRALGESMPTGPPPEPLPVFGNPEAIGNSPAPRGADTTPDRNTQAVPTAGATDSSHLQLVLIALLVAVSGVVAIAFGVRRRRSS